MGRSPSFPANDPRRRSKVEPTKIQCDATASDPTRALGRLVRKALQCGIRTAKEFTNSVEGRGPVLATLSKVRDRRLAPFDLPDPAHLCTASARKKPCPALRFGRRTLGAFSFGRKPLRGNSLFYTSLPSPLNSRGLHTSVPLLLHFGQIEMWRVTPRGPARTVSPARESAFEVRL